MKIIFQRPDNLVAVARLVFQKAQDNVFEVAFLENPGVPFEWEKWPVKHRTCSPLTILRYIVTYQNLFVKFFQVVI